jgi:hypothetical protein
MAANDYYDFNPSPTTWAILLTGIALFVLAISLVLIVMVDRGQGSGPAAAPKAQPPELPRQAPRAVEQPSTKAS